MLHQHNEAVCNKENQSSANRNSYQGQSIFTRHRAKNKEGDLAFNGEVAKKPARKKIVADNVARKGSIRHLHDGDSGDRPNHSGADDCEEMKVETVYSSEADAKQQRICPIEHEKPQSSNEPTAAPSNILTDEDLRKLPSYRISAKSTGEKHLREYQCDICEKYLLSKRTLAAHMKLHRAIPEVLENNVCDVCGKVLKNKNSLKNHKDTHLEARRYICSYCGKGFRIKNNMLEHTNTHTGLKPHHCTQCDKAFGEFGWFVGSTGFGIISSVGLLGRRTHLIVHMRIHSGHKPYKCSVEGCERKYAHGIDLKRHLYGAHRIYTKKFECQICSRIYSERKLLTKHMRTHCT